jgi:hypothetical protein
MLFGLEKLNIPLFYFDKFGQPTENSYKIKTATADYTGSIKFTREPFYFWQTNTPTII